ncbi:benzoate 1,2-dioxygenase electron transfer component BenC [Nocardia sp. NPDC058518]|uniref:benzoate 1,2-dioxygenase electron transfer component BenC n=1 Tax=Nocardia sp. NPDC058518 TaxID=3346534 RepID=UPI003646D8F5
MSYRVALSFEDGITRFVTCAADEVVADAAYRARVNIPLDCRDGACGTCKAFCDSGRYDGGDYIEEALTDNEADAGFCLPCQMTPRSDLVLRIAGTSDLAKTAAATFTGKVVDIQRFSGTTAGLTIEVGNRADLIFLPGQYVNLTVPGTDATRSYSFSNAPEATTVSFLVRLRDAGAMTDYLRERARPGDELTFTGPRGSFFLRAVTRPVLLVAGGTGLAPILSILEQMRADGVVYPVRLLYGASNDADLIELDRLDGFAAELSDFGYEVCVSGTGTSARRRGHVTDLITDEHLHAGEVDIYLCGPPPMVESARTWLTDHAITPANFFFEKFATSGALNSALAGVAS